MFNVHCVNTLEYLSLIMLSRQGKYTCTLWICIFTLSGLHHKEGINTVRTQRQQ
jgi:hypothetical protein